MQHVSRWMSSCCSWNAAVMQKVILSVTETKRCQDYVTIKYQVT